MNTDTSHQYPLNMPWYNRFRDEFLLATRNIIKFYNTKENIPEHTINNFVKESLAHFVFESNNIEKEGLSLGQTRELIFTSLSDLPGLSDPGKTNHLKNVLSDAIKFGKISSSIEDMNDDLQSFRKVGIAKYGTKNKDALTVLNQLMAALQARVHIIPWLDAQRDILLYRIGEIILEEIQSINEPIEDEEISTVKNQIEANRINGEPKLPYSLLDEDIIKKLHLLMGTNLIDKDYAQAGEYRRHSIMTDNESHYPAPDDVPRAMKRFIEEYKQHEKNNLNPILLASWASTQFVLIHPFSDFNGRLSRLIINIILQAHFMPFWIALRSNKRDRHRYITSLRHYRRNKITSIITLASIQINEGFNDLNDILALSGYKTLPEIPSFDNFDDLSNKELLSLRWDWRSYDELDVDWDLDEE